MPAEMKFCFDSNIPNEITRQLREHGADAIRCEEVGLNEVDDLVLLEYAASEGRTVVTNDQGFAGWSTQWLEQGKSHAGVFIITHDKENIGLILGELLIWFEASKGDDAALANEVYNQVQYIP